MTHTSRWFVRHAHGPASFIIFVSLFAAAAEAGPHRARLSRDLESRIASGRGEQTTVIVSGTDADVQALATRYGAVVKKSVRGGAVLEVTGGQLEALSDDPSVDHLSGDVPVQRMSITNEATGANQVWNGIAGLHGYTGRGIGVAVIDSGVATHAALRGPRRRRIRLHRQEGIGSRQVRPRHARRGHPRRQQRRRVLGHRARRAHRQPAGARTGRIG